MEVIHSIKAVVATENIDAKVVDDSSVSVTGRWWLRLHRNDFFPSVGLKIEAEEVISPVSTIVSAKYVEVVLKGDRSM